MPKTIRRTLFNRLQSSPTLADLKADLKALAGIELQLVAPSLWAPGASTPCSANPLCTRVRAATRGPAHCRRFVENLVVDARDTTLACERCDAGLSGFCVPVRLGGETLGYLLAGGYRAGAVDPESSNRLRHLLTRLNVADIGAALAEFETGTITVSEAQEEALQRWLGLAAGALIRSLDVREDASERPLPAFIVKICAVIQQRYCEPPSLKEAADLCGLSEGYFCRAFHEFTGLRFVEYLNAVRVEHVSNALLDAHTTITDAAFAAGFNSLSQFNRVFRKFKGVSPRQWRAERQFRLAAAG